MRLQNLRNKSQIDLHQTSRGVLTFISAQLRTIQLEDSPKSVNVGISIKEASFQLFQEVLTVISAVKKAQTTAKENLTLKFYTQAIM